MYSLCTVREKTEATILVPKFRRISRLSQEETALSEIAGLVDFRPDQNDGLWLATFVPCKNLFYNG
jgi:hypothetical protein